MTIGDWLSINRKKLSGGESLLLLSFVLNKEKTFLLAHPEHPVSQEERVLLDQFMQRRKKHEPLAYITGEKEFFGLPFFVTRATLVPRPETEILVEHVLDRIKNQESRIKQERTRQISLIDIGTGSGCIPISIAKIIQDTHSEIFPFIKCIATDISSEALIIARKNAARHDIEHSIRFHESNLLSDVPDEYFQASSIIITANLPYLSKEIYLASPDDVRLYEPQSALQGDEADGTTLMIDLLNQYLKKSHAQSFFLILEMSPEQGKKLLSQAKAIFPKAKASLLKDLSERDRFLVIQNH